MKTINLKRDMSTNEISDLYKKNNISMLDCDMYVCYHEKMSPFMICYCAGKAAAKSRNLIVDDAQLLSEEQMRYLGLLNDSYSKNIILIKWE